MRSPSPATRLRALLLAFALLLSATLPAAAQDGLYGPEAPRDVAFVRFVNATDAALEPTLDGATLALLEPGETGPYRTLAPGLHEAGAAALEARVSSPWRCSPAACASLRTPRCVTSRAVC